MFSKKIFHYIGIALLILATVNACNNDEPEEIVEMTFETVNGFIINQIGEKLLATNNGLFLFNKSTGKYEFIENKYDLKPINDLNYPKSLTSQRLWLASNDGVLNYTTDEIFTSSNSGLQNNAVKSFDFDFSNRGIFATPDGLSILDNDKWISSAGLNDIYNEFEISDIGSASNGFTYVTTKGGGVERFEMDVDGISGATIFDTDWTKLESNYINTVFIDSITQVYGTDMGVTMHFSEFTKWDWESYSTFDGLINNNVISVAKDKSDNWWFGTSEGLSRFTNDTWTNYTVETDNIISNNIKFLAVDSDGTVWLASDEGLSQFINNQWINYSK